MEQPLLEWLSGARRVRSDTTVVRELSWLGRRVDLVTLTRTGTATAYELKIRNAKRAIQQAAYNKLAFDRSYVVTASEPSEKNRTLVREAGVGLILVKLGTKPRLLESSLAAPTNPKLRRRLLAAIRRRSLDV